SSTLDKKGGGGGTFHDFDFGLSDGGSSTLDKKGGGGGTFHDF